MLVGLAASGAAAVAGTRSWIDFGSPAAEAMAAIARVPDQAPVPGSLALVALAGFGTLLVTRGRVRPFLAAATALAATLTVVSVALAAPRLVEQARADFASLGAESGGVGLNAWPGVAGVAATLALVAAVFAFREAPGWPEMGRRYDAPVAPAAADSPRAPDTTPGIPETTEDWWRAIDAGDDPTETADGS